MSGINMYYCNMDLKAWKKSQPKSEEIKTMVDLEWTQSLIDELHICSIRINVTLEEPNLAPTWKLMCVVYVMGMGINVDILKGISLYLFTYISQQPLHKGYTEKDNKCIKRIFILDKNKKSYKNRSKTSV